MIKRLRCRWFGHTPEVLEPRCVRCEEWLSSDEPEVDDLAWWDSLVSMPRDQLALPVGRTAVQVARYAREQTPTWVRGAVYATA